MFLKVNKRNLKKALVDIFIREGKASISPMQLCKKVQEIENYHILIFNKKTRKMLWYII